MHTCKDCNEGFRDHADLDEHMREEHPKRSKLEDEESDASSEDENQKEGWKINVWGVIVNSIGDRGKDLLETFKWYILFAREFEKDATVKKVYDTIDRAEDEEDMDWDEAVQHAIEKRKFLIQRQMGVVNNNEQDSEEE